MAPAVENKDESSAVGLKYTRARSLWGGGGERIVEKAIRR